MPKFKSRQKRASTFMVVFITDRQPMMKISGRYDDNFELTKISGILKQGTFCAGHQNLIGNRKIRL